VSVIKYEKMLTDTESTFIIILKALGFDEIDYDRLDFALKETSFASLQQKEADVGFRECREGNRFFRSGTAGQWKTELSDAQIARIESAFGDTMQRWGYVPKKGD
jgi:hypothetical protein